jgi:hypothetical protein
MCRVEGIGGSAIVPLPLKGKVRDPVSVTVNVGLRQRGTAPMARTGEEMLGQFLPTDRRGLWCAIHPAGGITLPFLLEKNFIIDFVMADSIPCLLSQS